MTRPILAVVTDVEGTTTPIAFVRDTLFPFARTRLPRFLADHADDPAVADELAAVRAAAPGAAALDTLLAWMDADVKATPLKALQGAIWRDGYARGALRGELYPDVAPALRKWAAAGLRLSVYSSGSVEAQRLLFAHAADGDLTGILTGFFDTRIGAKREAASYAAIAVALALPPGQVLFLSDTEAELDAAAQAGLQACQLVRHADGTVAGQRHPLAADFDAVAAQFGLAQPHARA